MSNTTSEEIENQFITFSEARKKYIEEKEKEINILTQLSHIDSNKFMN